MGYNASTNTYDTFADLRLAIGQSASSITVLGKDNPYDSLGGTFLWNPTSNYPDDDFTIIRPLDIINGRWIRATSADALSGRMIFIGDGVTDTFTHTFPVEWNFINNDYIIVLEPLNAASCMQHYISSKSPTSCNVTFISSGAFPIGSLQFDYLLRYTPNILDL